MKLYVDDLRACPSGWHLARTNTEAIRLLASGYVEEISLDHDICSREHLTAMSDETFCAVAYYIALMEKKPLVRFHTGNIDAGIAMAKIIGCEFLHEMHMK